MALAAIPIADQSYFEVTAQLIPLLFLAAALETRLRLPPAPGDEGLPSVWGALRRLALMATCVGAEAASLTAIAGRPNAFATYLVTGLLGVLGVLVLAPIVMREVDELRDHVESNAAKVALASVAALVLSSPLLGLVLLVL